MQNAVCLWAPTDERTGLGSFQCGRPAGKKFRYILSVADERFVPMTKDHCGPSRVLVSDVGGLSRYVYRLDDSQEYPDPASRFQPDGVHKPSEVVDLTEFAWTDSNWRSPKLEDSVFYELHVGTFSELGSLDGARAQLAELADLGVTTIELMPVAQFPGSRNWGYDGVYPFAVQNTYGGPLALQRFVNAAHARRDSRSLSMWSTTISGRKEIT